MEKAEKTTCVGVPKACAQNKSNNMDIKGVRKQARKRVGTGGLGGCGPSVQTAETGLGGDGLDPPSPQKTGRATGPPTRTQGRGGTREEKESRQKNSRKTKRNDKA